MKTIRVGITGHRILARTQAKEIETGMLKALSRIARSFPACKFEIVSALAEGADCLFAEIALDFLKAELLAVLPMAQDVYLNDFSSEATKEVFGVLLQKSARTPIILPKQISRETAYLKAGEYITDHCDILVAIWDGKPAQGPGGTGQIVELARRNKKLLIWILAGNRQPGTHSPTHLGKDQGLVRFERFPKTGSFDESLHH